MKEKTASKKLELSDFRKPEFTQPFQGEETKSPEIGFAYQLHQRFGGHGKNFTCQRRW